jgi:hypothetical protein
MQRRPEETQGYVPRNGYRYSRRATVTQRETGMRMLVNVLRRAWASGSLASLTSTAALVLAGTRDCRSVFAPVNAVSHWIWKDRAIRQDDASLRYTVTGYAIHHAASVFWALLFEGLAMKRREPREPVEVLRDAAAVSALAAVVDLRCTPERLTPGFERRVKPAPLASVYVAFGLGLAVSVLLGLGSSRRD